MRTFAVHGLGPFDSPLTNGMVASPPPPPICHPAAAAGRLSPRRWPTHESSELMPSMPTLGHRCWRVAAALALAVTAGACGADAATSSSTPTNLAALDTPPAAQNIAGGVCIDETPSIDKAVPELARKMLIERLKSWVPPRRAAAEASPAVAGLELLVRKITPDSVSLGPAGLVAQVNIPPVPGVARLPGPASNFVQIQGEYKKQVAGAEAARASATAAATTAATTVADADLSSPESEIRGCIEALARAMPRGTFLLISDLAQSGVPQVGVASLKQVSLVIVHVCQMAKACVAQETAWSQAFTDVGAASPVFLTVENMAKGFDQLLSAPAR